MPRVRLAQDRSSCGFPHAGALAADGVEVVACDSRAQALPGFAHAEVLELTHAAALRKTLPQIVLCTPATTRALRVAPAFD